MEREYFASKRDPYLAELGKENKTGRCIITLLDITPKLDQRVVRLDSLLELRVYLELLRWERQLFNLFNRPKSRDAPSLIQSDAEIPSRTK